MVLAAAALFFAQLFFGFHGIPRWMIRPLVLREDPPPRNIKHIVVLGGGGIPSATGLVRTYCAWETATNHPGAHLIVSLPSDGDPATNSVGRMRDELVLRGIPAKRIRLESKALNTREQAVNVGTMLGEKKSEPVLVITSGLHTKRAVLSFRRAGFTDVHGRTSREEAAEADMGSNLLMRYAFWANLQALIDIAREGCALLVYKLRGWI